ncbi:hypothetical protein DASB73_042690 [Starmerella bacillaris]|uniref:STAS domain-containing protein n=1 Tax=Starmerella bacillaris TaxID=1247836 RepID=A0AAV5RRQ6_STABA|nr:hypothetical protein DASB73_042690 [Starmerella bacillaris]
MGGQASETRRLAAQTQLSDQPYGTMHTTRSPRLDRQVDYTESAEDRSSLRSSNRRNLTSKWYVAYYFPLINLIQNYELSNLPGDICAGLTLVSFQIPVSLSYATSLAHVNPICGLLGLIIAPLIYACLGTVPTMVVAPEGPISLIVGKITSTYLNGNNPYYIDMQQISALVSGTAGAIILFFGLLRVGFLTNVLAQSLLRGFVTGAGMVMIADQLPVMLGISAKMHEALGPDTSSYEKSLYTFKHWRESKSIDCWFSLVALSFLIFGKALKRYLVNKKKFKKAVLIPDILLMVIVLTFVSYYGDFAKKGLNVVGEVSASSIKVVWMLRPEYWADFKRNFHSSFLIAILGLLESTVAARLLSPCDSITSSNRELVALGTSNLAASIVGSLPSFGGYGRSRINALCGGTSQVSGVIAALVTLLCTFKLMGLVYHLPLCTLSAIITQIGLNLLEEAPTEIAFFWKVHAYGDLITLLLSFFCTFFWSVEAGVIVGASAALIRLIHHATIPRIQILTRELRPGARFENADEVLEDSNDNYLLNSGILVIEIPEPLTFANSSMLEARLRRVELHGTTKAHPGLPRSLDYPLRTVVFHLKGMTLCDASAAATLKDIITVYLRRDIRVIFAGFIANTQVRDILRDSGIEEMLDSQHLPAMFPTLEDALADVNSHINVPI